MTFSTLLDGTPQNSLPVSDRGLAYGDGLFETLRIIQGSCPLFSLHWDRLSRSAARLAIPLPFTQHELEQAVSGVVSGGNGVAKLILTRGSGGRGYRSPDPVRARWLLQGMPLPEADPELYRSGISVRSCHITLSEQPLLAGMKHLNRLEQVMARREWQDEFFEGLMFGPDGHLIEATMANIFLFQGDTLLTPVLDRSGVQGVMRDAILSAVSSGAVSSVTKCGETVLGVEDLQNADAVFLCNGVRGLIPVSCWSDDRSAESLLEQRWSSVEHPGVTALIDHFHPLLHLPSKAR